MNIRICVLLLFTLCALASGCKKECGSICDPTQRQGYFYKQLAANSNLSVSAIDRVPDLNKQLTSINTFYGVADNNFKPLD